MENRNHLRQPTPLAFAWARAVWELAEEAKTGPQIGQELADIGKILRDQPHVALYFTDPTVGKDEHDKVIRGAFENRISKLTLNFLLLLNEKSRLSTFREISAAYEELLKRQSGRIDLEVTVAAPLSDEQMQSLRSAIGASLKRDPTISQTVDPSILGGLIVRVEDHYIDGSARTQLQTLRRQLLAARPT